MTSEEPDDRRAGETLGRTNPTWFRTALGKRLALVILVLFALFFAVAIWQALSSAPTADSAALVGPRGHPAPAFSLPPLSAPSHEVSLSAFQGKPLVVNFWASWCIPCRTEMPLLEKAYRAERGRVIFLGIDSNDSASGARAFLAQVHVTYVTVSDADGSVANRFGLYGLPTTIFISPSGKILGRHIGQLRADTLRTALGEAFPTEIQAASHGSDAR